MDANEIPYQQIETILKTSREDQIFLLKYHSRLPLIIQLELETKKKKTFHYLREYFSSVDNDILSYCAHILSVKTHYSFKKKFSSKKFDYMSLEDIRDVSMINIKIEDEKIYLKSAGKRSKLLHYWSVVKMYRAKKPKALSFDKISTKLKKHYNFTISHNEISKLWRKLEQD